MQSIYDIFLPYIPQGGYILDAGCGSGRDSKYFMDKGYIVDSFDLSPEMAQHTSKLTGKTTQVMGFQDLTAKNKYDGVWACASLLHVPSVELSDCIQKCMQSLKPNGILYASFKHGTDEITDNKGRYFNNITAETIQQYISQPYKISKIWTSQDVRSDKATVWVNVIVV